MFEHFESLNNEYSINNNNLDYNHIFDNDSENESIIDLKEIIQNSNNLEEKQNITLKEDPQKEKKENSNIQIIISNKTKRTKKSNKIKLDDLSMRKKCKKIILKNLFDFINKKICKLYNNNIGKGICTKQLKSLNHQKSETKVEFNKEFIYKTLYQIFTEKISKKITNFSPSHNKDLIISLLNEKNIEIKTYFNKLLNLSFLQCIQHYIGKEIYEELNEMPVFKDKIKNDIKKGVYDENYIKMLRYYFENYENIIQSKRARNRNKINKSTNFKKIKI